MLFHEKKRKKKRNKASIQIISLQNLFLSSEYHHKKCKYKRDLKNFQNYILT